jgi:hypothetical protein
MSRKKRRETPEWKWEQALIDAYYDYRWRQVLTPLHEKFKCWKAGELDHWDMDQAIHETHKENQHLYSLFNESRSFLVGMIQWDETWFDAWVVDHPPPSGVELASRRARLPADDENTDQV